MTSTEQSPSGESAKPQARLGETEGGEIDWSSAQIVMEPLRPVEFNAALALLQGMIGEEVEIVVKLKRFFFDCGLRGRLERVHTVLPEDAAVLVVLERGQGIALDPTELEAFVGQWPQQGPQWIEFHIGTELRVSLELYEGGSGLFEEEADEADWN
ncbi:MAG TPA: hypothetical protein VG518_08585 [Solirubrobacterales bacterium]|nr:hypothetical protein [Solirubrobacterales bacterium]